MPESSVFWTIFIQKCTVKNNVSNIKSHYVGVKLTKTSFAWADNDKIRAADKS